jgi:hypothetical protein
MMVISVYAITPQGATSKVAMAGVCLDRLFGDPGAKSASMHSSWPMVSPDDVNLDRSGYYDSYTLDLYPKDLILGHIELGIDYGVRAQAQEKNAHHKLSPAP